MHRSVVVGEIKFMSRFCSMLLAIILSVGSLPAQGPPKIRVLILTGVSNHQWPATTQVLRQILEQTGRFEVRVNEEVRGNGPETFAPYDVLLLNYTDRQQTEGPWWDNRAREALLDYVRNGKALESAGFRLTLVCCTECAATGEVTIPVPADLK